MHISQMLSQNSQTYPDDIALVELIPSQQLRKEVTWSEFEQNANRIADTLIDLGVRKGDKVIHLMRNSITWLEVYFGIIRTGAWAVPLNFRFTSSDIKYCADIAEAKVIFLEDEFTERIEMIRSQLTTLKDYIFAGPNLPRDMSRLEDLVARSAAQPTGIELTDDDACGLYFTSGTTGDPKPILLTHKNMEWAAIAEQKHHYQEHDDNFILIPPLYHAGAKMHWFGCLIAGARATLLNEVSPRSILETVAAEKGTIVWLLVPWAQDVLGALDRGEIKASDYDLSSWRLMHIGAQPVPPSLVKRWNEYFPVMQYDTNYGLTEAAGPGCVHLGIENEHKVGAIGKAGYGWQTRIVDETGDDVSAGKVGELLVKGGGVMKEYYHNPTKTAETIKEGWLYTGDMVKEDGDGFIYVVDRKKDVVISGGENIYPVEIEAILQGQPKIHDVAVIGLPDERLGEIAVAIVKAKPTQTLTEEEVMAFAEQHLPRYKRPKLVIFNDVPRNPTGKIEKPKLRQKYAGLKEGTKV